MPETNYLLLALAAGQRSWYAGEQKTILYRNDGVVIKSCFLSENGGDFVDLVFSDAPKEPLHVWMLDYRPHLGWHPTYNLQRDYRNWLNKPAVKKAIGAFESIDEGVLCLEEASLNLAR